MNPQLIKLGGVALGLAAIAGAAFLPAGNNYVQLALVGAGMGVLGWVGVRRPGDEAAPPATKPDP